MEHVNCAFSLLTRDPLLPLLLPCPDGHLLRLTLAPCDADALRAARFTDGKQNRENPILEGRLDIVGIDRPGESDRPFKRAGRDFPQEPVVSLRMALHPGLLPLLSYILLLRLGLALLLRRLTLRLTFGLVLMLVLMAVATSNRQGVLIKVDRPLIQTSWDLYMGEHETIN
jgi:hypothetical protein